MLGPKNKMSDKEMNDLFVKFRDPSELVKWLSSSDAFEDNPDNPDYDGIDLEYTFTNSQGSITFKTDRNKSSYKSLVIDLN